MPLACAVRLMDIAGLQTTTVALAASLNSGSAPEAQRRSGLTNMLDIRMSVAEPEPVLSVSQHDREHIRRGRRASFTGGTFWHAREYLSFQ